MQKRLNALDGYLIKLEAFRNFTLEDYKAREELHDLAARYLHLAAQCVIDMANHLIAEEGWKTPDGYRDSFTILTKNKVIDSTLCDQLQEWAGFRNILVHHYLDIDHGICYNTIRNDLGQLNAFRTIMAGYL